MGEVKVNVADAANEIDFAKISIPEAFKILNTGHHGLTTAEFEKRLVEYGQNKLPESTRIAFLVFLGYMWNPLSWAMEAAAILAIILLDYADFALIVGLLLINSTISYVEESNADKAIKALAAALAPRAKALRDGKFDTVDAINLVPGDVIIVKFGDIVPADIKLLGDGDGGGEETPMQVDQAALTGESLPVKKLTGDVCFSGSAIKQGERHAIVYATGINTFFGRAAALISATNNVANLQLVMTKIGGICLVTIGVWLIIELAVQFGHYGHECKMGEEECPTLVNILVVLVGGIPIAMPTVLSVTLALGAAKLAKHGAIVARMSAVEEMAGMDILCSDKTGTLTLNKLSIEVDSVLPLGDYKVIDVMKLGALSTNIVTEEPIDMVLYNSYPHSKEIKEQYKTVKFIPFNPTDKFTCATVVELTTGNTMRVLKGSPQVVLRKAWNSHELEDAVNGKMVEFANRGLRSLGVAVAQGDGHDGHDTKWEMVGLLPLFDPPRHDTKSTIDQCRDQGITVKMVTGDHLLIGKETARMLGMGTNILPAETLIKARMGDREHLGGYKNATEMVEKCNGFAEVFPEHKFEIVEVLQLADHIVGMTGDGVNDAPALKKADVGIAVAGATDAARGAADIVLTEPGLSAISVAIVGARKIFQRMTTYAKYTVAMTFRICFTYGLLTVIYDWYFPTILIVILAVFNDGAMIALSKDRVIPSRIPNSWNLKNIFIMGIVYGLYLTLSSWVLYQVAAKMNFFERWCSLFSLDDRFDSLRYWCTTHILGGADYSRPQIYAQYGFTSRASLMNSVCQIPKYNASMTTEQCNRINIISQCMTEQQYTRGAMLRSLLYTQVSISGQALVFVVRNQGWSITERAGSLTYIAFFLAQIGASLIGIFGFGGYPSPPEKVEGGSFGRYSTGSEILFFPNAIMPVAGTEGDFTASVIGCTGYVIVAWIWSMIWYIGLDPIKWVLCYYLNEDGFRDYPLWRRTRKHRLARTSKELSEEVAVQGMAAANYGNPLGRASLKAPVAQLMKPESASVVPVVRTSGGVARVSNDPARAKDLARRSQQNVGRASRDPASVGHGKE